LSSNAPKQRNFNFFGQGGAQRAKYVELMPSVNFQVAAFHRCAGEIGVRLDLIFLALSA
jgi:hypothetical protein